MFKLDAIAKYHRVLKELFETKPYLMLNMEDNAASYFKEIAPVLREKLSTEELTVMIEDMAITLSGGKYNDKFYLLKKVFDSLFIFQVDPEVVLGGAYEISGLTGLRP